jgi:hypothetical protein
MQTSKMSERELLRLRHELAGMECVVTSMRLGLALRRYDPNQPRVPAGRPGAGQWTGENTSSRSDPTGFLGSSDTSATEDVVLAARRGRRIDEDACWAQYERDCFQCSMVGLPACYAQAMERVGACLAGRPIPPLNY